MEELPHWVIDTTGDRLCAIEISAVMWPALKWVLLHWQSINRFLAIDANWCQAHAHSEQQLTPIVANKMFCEDNTAYIYS